MTATTIAPGTIIDLGEHCPRRCVTWDLDDTCWGLERTRMKSRRPGTVPFRAIAPITDPEAWMADPAALLPPTAPRPPAPAVGGPDPVGMVEAVFPGVEEVADHSELHRLAGKLLAAQRARDPETLSLPAWQRLGEVLDDPAAPDGALTTAARAVIDWCTTTSPTRLKLGGWKALTGQVEAFEREWTPQSRLEPWVAPAEPAA